MSYINDLGRGGCEGKIRDLTQRVDSLETYGANALAVIAAGAVPGRSGTVTVGAVTTGVAGSAAIVTNTGTPSDAVFNITIPQGAPGVPGLTVGIARVSDAGATAVPADVKMLRTQGFYQPGDSGDGSYRRVASNPNIGAGCFRTADRFMPDGSTSSVNGGWWRLICPSSTVRIEQVGGRGNAVYNFNASSFSGGDDNYQAMLDAEKAVDNGTSRTDFQDGATVVFGNGNYRFSETYNMHRNLRLVGNCNGGSGGHVAPTRLFWEGDRHCIVINATNTHGDTTVAAGMGGANGSVLYGLGVFNVSTGRSRNFHGIRMRGTASLINCYIDTQAPDLSGGNAVDIRARAGSGGDSEGNCNGWVIINCGCRAGSYGLKVSRVDANAGTLVRFQVRRAGLGGVWESGTLGNGFSGIQVDDCNLSVPDMGYCRYNGVAYMLVSEDPTAGGANNPATSPLVWESIENFAGFPRIEDWVPGKTYLYSPAVGIKGLGTASTVENVYTESFLCDASGSAAVIQGGTVGWTRGTTGSTAINTMYGMVNGRGVGFTHRYSRNSPFASSNGSADGGLFDGGVGMNPDFGSILRAKRAVDSPLDAFFQLRIQNRDYTWDYGIAGGIGQWGLFTGPFTTATLGNVVPRPFAVRFNRLHLADTFNSDNDRQISMAAAAPTTGGPYLVGQRIFNANTLANSGNPDYWLCTTTGAIATAAWAPNTTYMVGDLVLNNGRTYVAVLGPAWVANTAYAVGDIRTCRGARYQCTTAGTSENVSAKGPIGFGPNLLDGTCVWSSIGSGNTATAGTSAATTGPVSVDTFANELDGTIHWRYRVPFTFAARYTPVSTNVTVDLPSIAAGGVSAMQQIGGLVGAKVGDQVTVTCQTDLGDFIECVGRVSAPQVVRWFVRNGSAAAFDPANATYTIVTQRLV